jgi:hypothetical protein
MTLAVSAVCNAQVERRQKKNNAAFGHGWQLI